MALPSTRESAVLPVLRCERPRRRFTAVLHLVAHVGRLTIHCCLLCSIVLLRSFTWSRASIDVMLRWDAIRIHLCYGQRPASVVGWRMPVCRCLFWMPSLIGRRSGPGRSGLAVVAHIWMWGVLRLLLLS